MKVLIDAAANFEHVQVIRCDIWPKSVERCRDIENKLISEKSEGCAVVVGK
jgi:hypothetical protein